MKKMKLTYKGEQYPYKKLFLDDSRGMVFISTKGLEDEILMGLAQSDERAEDIDSLVCFYLSEDEWNMSDEDIVKLIREA
jgi:hypothetical protein